MIALFDAVVLIVAIVVVGRIMQSRGRFRHRGPEILDVTPRAEDVGETRRLRDEVTQLKQRIQVLERIAVEKENSLAREIDQLRDG